MTWTTGLVLEQLKREVDFFAWFRPTRFLTEETDEPVVVIGEVKSFGRNAIDDNAIGSLKVVATQFAGAIMVVASLREIGDYSPDELRRLRELALWGRASMYQGQPRNPLIVMTGTELFSEHGIYENWKGSGGETDNIVAHASVDPSNLFEVAELTQQRYLGLPRYWEDKMQAEELKRQRQKLARLIAQRGAPRPSSCGQLT
jgi:hypothetical protein